MKFSKDFKFGCASSGPQTEGTSDYVQSSNWDLAFSEYEEKFYQNIGPSELSKLEENLTTDLDLMQELGLESYRTSISWSKLISNNDTMEVDNRGLTFYNRLIDGLIERNIEPYINLSHFDLPSELQLDGGFTNKEIVFKYSKYAKKCFELFGNRVTKWITFNEPIVTATCAYMLGYHYPFTSNKQEMFDAIHNMQLASSLAIREYRNLNFDGEIGIVLNLSPIYTGNNPSKEDIEAKKVCELLHHSTFLDPSINGVYKHEYLELLTQLDVSLCLTDTELEVINDNRVDFLGVNYYQPNYVKSSISDENIFEKLYHQYVPDNARINPHRGWIIYPEGIYDLAMKLKKEYGNPRFYIAENGMGVEGEEKFRNEDGIIFDDYRVNFYIEHLEQLHKAIEEGSNCFGYHTWTFVDNWSWLNEYKNRYGFVELDVNSKERKLKYSAKWYQNLISTKCLD